MIAEPAAERRIAILQRVCSPYRMALFRALSAQPDTRVRLLIGDDLPHSKVRNAEDLSGLDVIRMPTRFVRVGRRLLVWHLGVFAQLRAWRPDVIVAEGESNVLSYLKALLYRCIHRRTAVVHWSLGGLPGEPMVRAGASARVINRLRRCFDGYITYSTYGKDVLVANGIAAERVTVATNVSDIEHHLHLAGGVGRAEARSRLGLGVRFVILFVGALTRDKRLEPLLEAMQSLDPMRFECVIVGDGEARVGLAAAVREASLPHVRLVGRVTVGIEDYFAAADVLVLPGRGGMVISEAMAYGLPVVAFQADGTERDLIEHEQCGWLMERGDAEEIRTVIERLAGEAGRLREMGRRAQERVAMRFTTAHMLAALNAAIGAAAGRRQ